MFPSEMHPTWENDPSGKRRRKKLMSGGYPRDDVCEFLFLRKKLCSKYETMLGLAGAEW